MATTKLIVGLGNPGAQYARTRHNIGFEVVEAAADRMRVAFEESRAPAYVAEGRWRSRPFVLAMPTTYMNISGEAVRALSRIHNVAPKDILIIYDDLNLDIGAIRLRPGGSAGGHNGIQHVIDLMKTDAIPRMRIGIGSDFAKGHQVDYVLAPFSAEERPVMDATVEAARDAVLTFVNDGITKAMNRHNQRAVPQISDESPSEPSASEAS